MFGWSVKSVPGCFVLIAPSRIVDPVAFTPGFGPHDDVLTLVEVPLLLVDPAVAAPVAADPPAAVLELPLLPQPASATSAPSATVTAIRACCRERGTS
jgi:hypothetical protein